MSAVSQDVALPAASGSSYHPLPELPLVKAAGAQVEWQSGSHAVDTEGTHGKGSGGGEQARREEEE